MTVTVNEPVIKKKGTKAFAVIDVKIDDIKAKGETLNRALCVTLARKMFQADKKIIAELGLGSYDEVVYRFSYGRDRMTVTL